MQQSGLHEAPEVAPGRALEHLEEILRSPAFSSSKRCQEFLRYIVIEATNGRAESIKERNIALEVFGKGTDFEPGEDSLVRVKAREVRKRLSEYYESATDHGLKIELPVGGYIPRIHSTPKPISKAGPSPPEPLTLPDTAPPAPVSSLSRRRFGWMLGGALGGALGVAGAVSLAPLVLHRNGPLDRLWRPIFDSKVPLLIFIPVLTDRSNGQLTDRVGIGPAAVLRRAADFLTRRNYPYHLRFGADLTFAQLREQPSLLLGGFSSIWTQRITSGLHYTLDSTVSESDGCIRDTKTGQSWQAVNRRANGYADQDFGLLCRLFDSDSGQIVLLAAGITTFATEGAGAVFFDPASFSTLLRHAPVNWETKNFQAVVRVSIFGTTPSSPEIVATYFW
jgi:hypothetical protein